MSLPFNVIADIVVVCAEHPSQSDHGGRAKYTFEQISGNGSEFDSKFIEIFTESFKNMRRL
jgi:hypothetical protein